MTDPVVSGRSLITNLESFANRVTGEVLEVYYPTGMTAVSSFDNGFDNGAEATTESAAAAMETMTKAARSSQTILSKPVRG